MKAYYDNEPSVVSEVGNGSILYRYNISEEVQPSNEDEESKVYSCDEVVVWKPITSNKIVEAVITDRWDANYEQKLINDYNMAKMGLCEDKEKEQSYINAYSSYLRERASVKAQVDADCKVLNIR